MTAAEWREHLAATKGRIGKEDLEALLSDLSAAEARALIVAGPHARPWPPRRSPPPPPPAPTRPAEE